MLPSRIPPSKSQSAPDMENMVARHHSFIINSGSSSRSSTPINMPLLLQDVEMDADKPLQFYPDEGLIQSAANDQIVSNIRYVLTASSIYVETKRRIFENAINCGYKKALGGLINDIRRAGGIINLEFADMSNLDLSDFDLHGMTAKNASFINSDLSRSNLSTTCLVCTDLSGVTARETRFDNAVFDWTIVNSMTTDNRWIAKSQVPHTETYPDKTVTNIYVQGKCPKDLAFGAVLTLPAGKIVHASCCRCVIL